jgi:hypothetical protein
MNTAGIERWRARPESLTGRGADRTTGFRLALSPRREIAAGRHIEKREERVVTIVIVAFTAIVVVLLVLRITSKGVSAGSSSRTTRDRRSGAERRRQRIRVPFERRREPRRLEDVASDYVARIEPDSPNHRSIHSRT